jgi:hypothetical protein
VQAAVAKVIAHAAASAQGEDKCIKIPLFLIES